MHLEKVTTRSSEAALAGWISSNDVTLFTVVLVVVVAIFLHSKLNQSARENVQSAEEKASLSQQLAATAGERDSSISLLSDTRKSLALTQAERDKLQQDLAAKLEAIAKLNAKLDAILREKGSLETERASLATVNESLTVSQRDLKTSNADLATRLDAIASQLSQKIAALEKLEEERKRLKKQADELDAIVAGLKAKLKKLNIELTDSQLAADASRDDSLAKVKELEAQVAASDKTADEYLARLKRAAALFEGLKAEKKQLEVQLSQKELERQTAMLAEGRNNRELLGLGGKLERVAVLFDASGSMRQAAASGGGDRWAEAQQMAGKWLKHLNVQHGVLIVYSSDVQAFPKDGKLADLRGEAGNARRDELMQHLKEIAPGGTTNTYAALRKAYEYDVDTIVLFSDGAPSESDKGTFDPAAAQRIYELCRTHARIPINTVGLGNYFDQNASTFLRTVADITGGTFRGE